MILGCFGIYTYTVMLPVYHYCDWTGLRIEERLGNEVSFIFVNGTIRYYACINVSLLAFERLIDTGGIDQLSDIRVRCAQCGMLMDWDDPMIVWICSHEYVCPTTGTPTIVAVCDGLCESHFLDRYGGIPISTPYIWPESR